MTAQGWERTSDREILQRGDADAFGVFYRRHLRWVAEYAARRTRDPEAAADLTAEVFAAALLGRRRFDDRQDDATAWLFRIACNKVADWQRRGYADRRLQRRLGMERVALSEVDRRELDALSLSVVSGLLEPLADEQRAALRGRVLEDRDYAELAAAAGVSEQVMRQRVSRGLRLVRRRLEGGL